MFQEFPYTDLHQLNLDWIIKIVKDFFDRYPEVINQINSKVNKPIDNPDGANGNLLMSNGDGSTEWIDYDPVIEPKIQRFVDEWLDEHPEATTTVEDGSLTKEKFTNALQLETLKDYLTPQMFGAVADGETDDYQAIMDCFAAAAIQHKPVYFPEVENGYYVATPVSTSDTISIIMDSPIIAETDGIIIGSADARIGNSKFKIKTAGNGTGTGIKFVNIFNCEIYVESHDFTNGCIFQGENGSGFVYNLITLGKFYNFEYGIILNSKDSGWCNENLFLNGRFAKYGASVLTQTGVLITSEYDYPNNNNVFIKTCVEGDDVGFRIEYGRENTILFCRTEDTTLPFYFAAETRNHCVFVGVGNTNSEDYGLNNVVLDFMKYVSVAYPIEIFNSGHIADYAFTAGNHVNIIGKYICTPADNIGGVIVPRFEKEIGSIIPARPIGVFVDTTINKKFCIRATRQADEPTRYAVKMFDANGNELTTGIITGTGHGGRLSYNANGITTGIGAFVPGANQMDDLLFEVPAECTKAYIGVRNPSVTFHLQKLEIFGTEKAYVYPSGLSNCLPNMPTCPGTDGDIVLSASTNNTGWKYYNNAWNAF